VEGQQLQLVLLSELIQVRPMMHMQAIEPRLHLVDELTCKSCATSARLHLSRKESTS
jgi:hypothetical protein